MKARVYQSESIIPGDPRPHTFIELSANKFIEVELPRLTSLTGLDNKLKLKLNNFVRNIRKQEETTNTYHLTMTRNYFTITKFPSIQFIGTF